MKRFNQVKKFSTRVCQGAFVMVATSGVCYAEGSDPWTAIDFAGFAAKIGTAGVAIIGICMALKGTKLGKRVVNML